MSVVSESELPFDINHMFDYCTSDKNNVSSSWTVDQILEWLRQDTSHECNEHLIITNQRTKSHRKSLNRKSNSNYGKLWEFLRDLLKDSRYCPSLIKWHDYRAGEFKFVRGEQVAKIWGLRNNNPNMSYDKLSRAMRYHYKGKVLLPVKGQRLVYKFGPNAIGWQTSCPILE